MCVFDLEANLYKYKLQYLNVEHMHLKCEMFFVHYFTTKVMDLTNFNLFICKYYDGA